MRTDENGLERGMLICGPLSKMDEDQGRTRLLTVSRIRGKQSISCIAHYGDMLAEYEITSTNMRNRDEWSLMRWDEKAGTLAKVPWPEVQT